MVRTSARKRALIALEGNVESLALVYQFLILAKGRIRRRLIYGSDNDFENQRLTTLSRRLRSFRNLLLAAIQQLHDVQSSRYLSRPMGRGLKARRSPLFEYYLHMDDVWFKQMVSEPILTLDLCRYRISDQPRLHPSPCFLKARMTHDSFFRLHGLIKDDPVFHNNSRNPQSPSEYQLLLTLRRLGMGGNGASVGQTAQMFSVSGQSQPFEPRSPEAGMARLTPARSFCRRISRALDHSMYSRLVPKPISTRILARPKGAQEDIGRNRKKSALS